MKKLKLEEKELSDVSIRDAFGQIELHILPNEINETKECKWVILTRGLTEERTEDLKFEDLQALKPDPWFTISLKALVVQGYLVPRINFYYSTLFHIGRNWNISEKNLTDLEIINSSSTFEDAVQNIKEAASRKNIDTSNISREEIHQYLGQYRQYAISKNKENLDKARHMWGIWKEEVSSFQSDVYEFLVADIEKENLPFLALQMILKSLERSRLQFTLNNEGLIFKSGKLESKLDNRNTADLLHIVQLIRQFDRSRLSKGQPLYSKKEKEWLEESISEDFFGKYRKFFSRLRKELREEKPSKEKKKTHTNEEEF